MFYIKDIFENEIMVNKSRFIALAYPLSMEQDYLSCLEDAKMRYPKATHYTHAYIYGAQGEHAHLNDDGEPSRTAGMPIYDVMRHHDITNIMVIVVRYFGGVKLGAGGLVRAYSGAAAALFNHIKRYELRRVYRYIFTFSYALLGKLDQRFEEHGTITHRSFSETLTYDCLLFEDRLDFLDEYRHLIKYKRIETVDELVPV